MKNIVFIVLLFVNASFGQVSIMPFYSLSFERQDADLKERIGNGIALSCDLNKNIGIGLQVRDRELWRLNSKVEEVISLKTFTGQFYVHGTNDKESKWLFFPVAGVMAGIVSPVDDPEYSKDFLEIPIVVGIYSELHLERKLSKNFNIGIFFKVEGELGFLRDRSWPNENFSTAGFLSGGTRINYHLGK